MAAELPPTPDDWGIDSATLLADGIGGRVWRVQQADGSTAILKALSELAVRDRADGVAFLRWRDGHGAIRLLDARDHLLLLEDAGDLRLLDLFHRDGDEAAALLMAELVRRLHEPGHSPMPHGLVTTRDHFASLFAKASTDRDAGPRTQFVEAAEIAERLLAGERDVRPLHGDLHHENALLSPRGWLAIDPKGVVGDPGFDLANMFYNPLDSDQRYIPDRANRLAEILAPAVNRAPEVLLDWAFAFSGLSAAWHAEDGNEEEAERSLAVGRAVREAAKQVRS